MTKASCTCLVHLFTIFEKVRDPSVIFVTIAIYILKFFLGLSVGVSKLLQVAILARSSREMSQIVRID